MSSPRRWARAARDRIPARSRAGVAVVAAALALVGGGAIAGGLAVAGGSGSAGPDGAPAAQKVVTIGVIAPLSGDAADDGDAVRKAVTLAAEQGASTLGPGWKIKVRTSDDASRPDGGAQAAEALTGDATVAGVVGPLSSTVARIAVPTLSTAGIAVVSPANGDPALTGAGGSGLRTRPYRTYFRLSGTDVDEATVAADYAVRTAHRRRIAVVVGDDGYPSTLADTFASRVRDLHATVTGRYTLHDEDDEHARSLLLGRLLAGSPDLIYTTADASAAASLRRDLADLGSPLTVMGADSLMSARYVKSGGPSTRGDLVVDLGAPASELPSASAFLAAYEQRWSGDGDDGPTPSSLPPTGSGPSSTPSSTGPSGGATAASGASGSTSASPSASPSPPVMPEPPVVAAYAYDAARTLIAAMVGALAGHVSVDQAVRAAVVAGVGRAALAGATGPVAFDAYGDVKAADVTVYTVRGGRFVPVAVVGRH